VVREQLQRAGRYLLLEDTSELSWSGKAPISGLGPVGNDAAGLQGFHLHSVLAVRWLWKAAEPAAWPGRPAVDVLGLPVQHYHLRQPCSKEESGHDSKVVKARARESQ
jgi:hypothetical protein